MEQVDGYLKCLLDKLVGTDALDVDDESDAARIMFLGGVVKSLGAGRSRRMRVVSLYAHGVVLRASMAARSRGSPGGGVCSLVRRCSAIAIFVGLSSATLSCASF